ncbi:hypothetical protein HHA01_24000 [Halomonas halmophila]|uniref:Uncharacterized protein n=2 Tax=Halomonas halmophila TaxID=252 RepID=A0A4Y4F2A8_9GAMM|nr:hypothetical protein HHA01_24000 [Halomonas halmophila]
MINRQSRILSKIDVESFGFLGLTEKYEKSLEVFNKRYSSSLPVRNYNRGGISLEKDLKVSDEHISDFYALNKRDVNLYSSACVLFDSRYSAFQNNDTWAHARLVEAKPGRVAGWAWWEGEREDPVLIEVWANDQYLGAAKALEFRPALCRLRPPRGGYVGFHLPVKLAVGDKVQCRVASTGQCFPINPRSVTKPEAK